MGRAGLHRDVAGGDVHRAGRANGTSESLDGDYDGYAECVRTRFDPTVVGVKQLMAYFFEIIDPTV